MSYSIFKCEESREKVYCSECRWFEGHSSRDFGVAYCRNSKNLGNWRDRRTVQKSPKEINKYNNCPWFEKLEITEGYLKKKFKEMQAKVVGNK